MSRRSLPLGLLAASTALLLVPTAATAAPPSVVNFDDLAAGTKVVDQYNTPGRQIQFGHPNRFVEGSLDPNRPDHCPSSDNTGLLRVRDGGISGRSASLGCSTGTPEFPHVNYLTALHTDIERRGVSFRLRGLGLEGNAVTMKLYGVGRVLLGTQTITVSGSQVANVSVTRPGADLVTVTLQADSSERFTELVIDDISMPLDDVPPPPKFEIGLGRPSVDVVEGSSVGVPINVLRYNGSSGAVTLSVGSLPPGIVGAQVQPNPVTGTSPPTLTIAADTPLSGDRQLSVTAGGSGSAGTFIGGGRVQTVRGVPALELAGGGRVTVVPGCGEVSGESAVKVRGGFTGPVSLTVSKTGGPVQVLDSFVSRDASGDGTLRFAFRLKQAAGMAGGSDLRLTFRPRNATALSQNIHVFEQSVRIDSIRGSFGAGLAFAPENVPGYNFGRSRSDTVRLEGAFPSGCELQFVDRQTETRPGGSIAARPLSVLSRDPGGPDQPASVTLRLPSPPVSTDVRALGPDGAELARSSRIEVLGFRNDPALSAQNSGANAGAHDYTWSDFIRAFGSDDGDACFIGCVRDPFALQAFDNLRDKYRRDPGLCFGYSTMALRFQGRLELPQQFTPGIFRGFQLPFVAGTAIKQQVLRWQSSQYDSDWQGFRKDQKEDVPSFAQFRQRLRDVLAAKDQVYIAITQGNAGHAVVAYDVRDRPLGGGIDILTYNPNYPYSPDEETNARSLEGNARLSRISVDRDGKWSGGIFTSGGAWSGGMDTIEIYDRMPPSDADLPFGFFAQSLDAGPETAEVTSIKAGGTETLRPDGTALPGTGVEDSIAMTGVKRDIDYDLTRGRSYALTITGKGPGSYGDGLLGGDAGARVQGLKTKAGQQDRLTLTPGSPKLALRSGGGSPASVELLDRVGGGKATRMATVALTTRRGGGDDVALTGGALTLRHAGAPTTVSATLGSVGAGAPGAVTTKPISVGTGEQLSLAPASWADPAAGVRLTLRDRSGRVVRRGRAALKGSTAVGLGGVKAQVARPGGKVRVQVTGQIKKAGGAPVLVANVDVLRGRRVLQRTGASLRGTAKVRRGKFALPVALKTLPRGARARVTVTLVDEAAGFASARRQVTAR